MDTSNVLKLSVEEREFFLNAEKNKENWIKTFFPTYTKPLAIGIGIQNQFLDNENQTVKQWKNLVRKKKLTSFARLKRIKKHKIYVTLIGPFPDYFYYENEFNMEVKNCTKNFLEIFFPGRIVVFLQESNYKTFNVATRIHEKSNQTQLFLPDVNAYLRSILPQDALCVCGLSWFDFFPSHELNHILGEGSIENGTVAFSFGHYALFKEKELMQASSWKGDYAIERPYNVSDGLNNERGFYDFVTEHEKEEAKIFTLECDQEGCAGSKLARTRKKGRGMLNLKGLFKQRKLSVASSRSDDSNDSTENNAEEEQDAIMVPTYDESLDSALPPNTRFNLNCKILRRLLRVMSHEICHVLGMSHCQYFSCTMNTSASVLHTDIQPLILCPVCLRKLQLSNDFRIKNRYDRFLKFLLLHTEVCEAPGLDRADVIRMEETQVLGDGKVCLFKNDVQTILSIIEVLNKESEDFGFETVEADQTLDE